MTAGQRELPEAEIVLGEATRIDGVPDEYELVSVSLGIDGVLTCAWASSAAREFIRTMSWARRLPIRARVVVPDWGAYPFATTSEPLDLLITATHGALTEITVARGIDLRFPRIVRLPSSGDFVVAAGRCRFRFKVAEKNARRISPNGEILDEGTMGDCINHMAATLQDDIWVSYGDEGVFGIFDWGPRGEPPNGTGGLMRFRTDFTVDWTYSQPDRVDICDCYMMNLGNDGLFICPYPDFPVVKIGDDISTVWEGRGQSTKHLLVAGSHVAFLRGYRTFRDHGTLVDLATNESRDIRLSAPRSMDWSAPAEAGIAGDTLALVQGRRIFTGRLQP
jgi:hypothetical protein